MTRLNAIRRSIADFDAIHGRGAAFRDLALGALAFVAIALQVVVLAAAVPS